MQEEEKTENSITEETVEETGQVAGENMAISETEKVAEENPPIEQVVQEELKPEQPVETQQIGNQTITKKGDTVTITEIIPEQPVTHSTPSAFPAPFKQNDLWKKFLEKLGVRKKKKLDRILEFLNKKNKITNDEVEKLLHVSDATATRYLEQLEKENKVHQVGKTGKYTYYEKI